VNGTVHAWTRFPVGLEEAEDGWSHVHAFTLPGCAAVGETKEVALESFMKTLGEWLDFLAKAGEPVPSRDSELEILVEEWVLTDANLSAGDSTACFAADRAPLGELELTDALHRLGLLRGRLLPHIRRAMDRDLEAIGAAEWNVRLVLDELARAQWWTLTRLGASPLAEVPERLVARLDTAMALIIQTMTELPIERLDLSVELDGEEWTPRKVLRRLLWLEWSLGGAALGALEANAAGSR
jgi:predicted RNase H-like HicB family nuclease